MPEKKFIFDESQNHDLDTDSDDANDTEASSRDHRAAAEADIGRTFGAKLKHFFAERVLPVSDPAEAAERQGNPLLHKNARIAYGVLLVFAVTLNLYAVSRLSVHLLGSWAENVLYVLRFDSVSLRSVSFAQVCAILAYIFSFIFGGCITFVMLKLAGGIAVGCRLIKSSRSLIYLLTAFIVVFAFGTVAAFAGGTEYAQYQLLKWLCPLLSYIGGLCFLKLSDFHLRLI